MAARIITHNSTTGAAEPANLEQGELAVNIADQKLWVGDGTATPVVLVDPENNSTPEADEVTYDNVDSGLTATDVKAAIDEVVTGLLGGYKIEVYASGALPNPPRDANTIYIELI
jgi:hypothetical protein